MSEINRIEKFVPDPKPTKLQRIRPAEDSKSKKEEERRRRSGKKRVREDKQTPRDPDEDDGCGQDVDILV